jgi:hypothetical protein
MCVQFTPEERAQMEALKAAFDPKGLLNPGKLTASPPVDSRVNIGVAR